MVRVEISTSFDVAVAVSGAPAASAKDCRWLTILFITVLVYSTQSMVSSVSH